MQFKVLATLEDIQDELDKSGKPWDTMLNESLGAEVALVTKLHLRLLAFTVFKIQSKVLKDTRLAPIIQNLGDVYLLEDLCVNGCS